jgi:hypothetical protein
MTMRDEVGFGATLSDCGVASITAFTSGVEVVLGTGVVVVCRGGFSIVVLLFT